MSLPSVPHVSAVLRWPTAADAVFRYWITAVCAGSAGVHAALIQPHLSESLPLGLAFAAATAALAVAALMMRQPRHDSWAPAAATAVLGVIAVSYLLSKEPTGP
jgi:hypothetical protein